LHAILHKALSQALAWYMVPRNVAEAVKPPRPTPREMRPLTSEEAHRLLQAACDDRFEALYVLAVTTGMRQGELLALRWQDVDKKNGTLSVRRTLTRSGGRIEMGEPKTKKSRRSIRLTPRAIEALETHLERQLRGPGVAVHHEHGPPDQPLQPAPEELCSPPEKARLPHIRFHDLRHTCATLLLGQGTHPKYVQELWGHATIAISLDTYSHVMPGMSDHTARAMQDALSSLATR